MSVESATAPSPRIDEGWIRALPKAEVHVHLEGGFGLVDLLDLAKAAGERLPRSAATLLEKIDEGFDSDFDSEPEAEAGLTPFLRFLDWGCGLVRTPEQAARHAYRFAARQTSSGIRYSDVVINPAHWAAWRGRLPELFDAFAGGLGEAHQDGLAQIRLCVSLLRSQSSTEAVELVEWITQNRPQYVVALSVDGDERRSGRVSAKFAQAFDLAARSGLHRTVHAGESSGPEGVWDAVNVLGAQRVDHGVRAVEDPRLVDHLVQTQIPLGVCPRSNVALGIYDDWSAHPLVRLRDAGVNVTINTDDPGLLGSTLEGDWAVCAATFGLDESDLIGFARASVAATFADDNTKSDLIGQIDEFERTRHAPSVPST